LGAKVQNNCEIAMRKMPVMPIMLVTNFAKVSNFGKVCAVKSDISELSKGNGEVRKRRGRDFGEKRL